jgi:hypothetical protein
MTFPLACAIVIVVVVVIGGGARGILDLKGNRLLHIFHTAQIFDNSVVLQVDQEAAERLRVIKTAIVAISIATRVQNDRFELLALASGEHNLLVGIVLSPVGAVSVSAIVKGYDVIALDPAVRLSVISAREQARILALI